MLKNHGFPECVKNYHGVTSVHTKKPHLQYLKGIISYISKISTLDMEQCTTDIPWSTM